MKNRFYLPERERVSRSRLAKIASEHDFIVGSLVATKQTCGKENCKCKKGEKHDAVYVALKYKGKRKMLSVAPECRPQMQQAVLNYKKMRQLMEAISEECCNRLLDKTGR